MSIIDTFHIVTVPSVAQVNKMAYLFCQKHFFILNINQGDEPTINLFTNAIGRKSLNHK